MSILRSGPQQVAVFNQSGNEGIKNIEQVHYVNILYGQIKGHCCYICESVRATKKCSCWLCAAKARQVKELF